MQKIQRIGPDLLTEETAEVGGTQMAEIRQEFHGEILRVILTDIVQRGIQNRGRGHGKHTGTESDPQQPDHHGQQKAPDAGLVSGLAVRGFPDQRRDQGSSPGVAFRFQQEGSADNHIRILPVIRQLHGQAFQHPGNIDEQIAPEALRIRSGPCGMLHARGDEGDSTPGEGELFLPDGHLSAATPAQPDFHTVVKMQMRTVHGADQPVVPVKGQQRKIRRQFIASVFRNDHTGPGQMNLLPSRADRRGVSRAVRFRFPILYGIW